VKNLINFLLGLDIWWITERWSWLLKN